MESKKFTQIGKTPIIFCAGTFLAILIFTFAIHRDELEDYTIAPVGVVLAFVIFFLYKLNIIISDEFVEHSFSIGLWKCKYKIKNIKSAEPVTNSWLTGYGIGWMPNGWVYNVSGKQAVELTFNDRKSVVRIGTDKPEEVAAYINSKLSQ